MNPAIPTSTKTMPYPRAAICTAARLRSAGAGAAAAWSGSVVFIGAPPVHEFPCHAAPGCAEPERAPAGAAVCGSGPLHTLATRSEERRVGKALRTEQSADSDQ